jgi:DNA-binding IscR family transcriptional regulator
MDIDVVKVIIALWGSADRQCDNVGGPTRSSCQCEACEGRRAIDRLQARYADQLEATTETK